MATKMKASGNQRSAHAVKPIAIRTSAPSCLVEPPEESAVVIVVIMVKSSPNDLLSKMHVPRFSNLVRFR
jgi:hypothetical protein